MTKKAPNSAPGEGHNTAQLEKDIQQAMTDMDEIDAERLALNERAGKVRADLEVKGIPRTVFSAARNFVKTDEDKRKGFDAAYAICRKAMGVALQSDLFAGGKPAE